MAEWVLGEGVGGGQGRVVRLGVRGKGVKGRIYDLCSTSWFD